MPSIRPHRYADAVTCESPADLVAFCRSLPDDQLLAADLFCGAGGLGLGLDRAGITTVLGVDTDKKAAATHRRLFHGMTVDDWDLGNGSTVETVSKLITDCGISVVVGGPPCQPFSKAGSSLIRSLVTKGKRADHDGRRDLWISFLEIVRNTRPVAVLMENVPEIALDRDGLIIRTMVDELEKMGYGVEVDLIESGRQGVPQLRNRLILVALSEGRRYRFPDESEDNWTLGDAIGDLPALDGGERYGFRDLRSRVDSPPDATDVEYRYIRPVTSDWFSFSEVDVDDAWHAFSEELGLSDPLEESGDDPGRGDDGSLPYQPARSEVSALASELAAGNGGRVHDHEARMVRWDDRQIYEFMRWRRLTYSDPENELDTRYPELPDRLRRYRKDIFDDKYKLLSSNQLSRAITAHIAKDGYWYIHPRESRTLTVREAARVQTFPDHVRFAGSRSDAYQQIGNAVPPKLAERLGVALVDALRSDTAASLSTAETAHALASWVADRHASGLCDGVSPWTTVSVASLSGSDRSGGDARQRRWLVLLGELCCPQRPPKLGWEWFNRNFWDFHVECFGSPELVLEHRDELEKLKWRERESRESVVAICRLAEWVLGRPDALYNLDVLEEAPGVSVVLARTVFRLVPGSEPEVDPLLAPRGLLRVAGRHAGPRYDGRTVFEANRGSAGRIAVARLIGVDREGDSDPILANRSTLAHIGLTVLSESVCTPTGPAHEDCPIRRTCHYFQEEQSRGGGLAEPLAVSA